MDLESLATELKEIASRLDEQFQEGESPAIADPTQLLMDACMRVGDSSSDSWLGYHSLVYYRDFRAPPAGAHFSPEWGLMPLGGGSTGAWVEYPYEEVVEYIESLAGDPNVKPSQEYSKRANAVFAELRSEIISILTIALESIDDVFVQTELEIIKSTKPLSQADAVALSRPQGQFSSRDSRALHQGLLTPPHIVYTCGLVAIMDPGRRCGELSIKARQLAKHLERKSRQPKEQMEKNLRVFIGHGHSLIWRELKDFLSDRLKLEWEEFNRISAAGVGTTERLESFLDGSCMAFIVCSAEDEHADGTRHARENVIHEIGLFQGRLGFKRAIVLLEEGCEEFSNIHGLGQIRFPAGKISACFEEIRQVLERELII
jgi:predicted nucleotide-binding protein